MQPTHFLSSEFNLFFLYFNKQTYKHDPMYSFHKLSVYVLWPHLGKVLESSLFSLFSKIRTSNKKNYGLCVSLNPRQNIKRSKFSDISNIGPIEYTLFIAGKE